MIRFNACQWGVGHGGFHTQMICVGESHCVSSHVNFELIYDCGSSNKPTNIAPQIDDYLANRLSPDEDIDLLVISHFDLDHVSGLSYLSQELRSRNLRIRRILIPFVPQVEREAFKVMAWINSGDVPGWYNDLVDDPVGTLTGRPNENDDGARAQPSDHEPMFPEAEVVVVPVEMYEDDDLPPAPRDQSPFAKSTDAHSLSTFISAIAGKIVWELRPFAIQATHLPKTIQEFEKHFNDEVQKNSAYRTLPFLSPSRMTPQLRIWILDRFRKELKAATVASGFTTNGTSICLYSGPPVEAHSKGMGDILLYKNPTLAIHRAASPCQFTGSLNRKYDIQSSDFAWLGTGDAPLKEAKDVLKLKKFLGDRCDFIRIVGVPHHGSRRDSSFHLWKALPFALIGTLHSNGKLHGHPNKEVMMSMVTENILPCLVNSSPVNFVATESGIWSWQMFD